MPPVAKQKFARSHPDALLVVCAACWRKNKNVRSISDNLAELIRKHVYKDFNLKNGYHPTVVCDGCRKAISDLEKVGASFHLLHLRGLFSVCACTPNVTTYLFVCQVEYTYMPHYLIIFFYRMGKTPRDIFLQPRHMQICVCPVQQLDPVGQTPSAHVRYVKLEG